MTKIEDDNFSNYSFPGLLLIKVKSYKQHPVLVLFKNLLCKETMCSLF